MMDTDLLASPSTEIGLLFYFHLPVQEQNMWNINNPYMYKKQAIY